MQVAVPASTVDALNSLNISQTRDTLSSSTDFINNLTNIIDALFDDYGN